MLNILITLFHYQNSFKMYLLCYNFTLAQKFGRVAKGFQVFEEDVRNSS